MAADDVDANIFTRKVDQRIFEGYLGDREAMFGELERVGLSRKAVARRAETLGLSATLLDVCRDLHGRASVRHCLSCSRPFVSLGFQNRMCKQCARRS